MGSAIGRYAGRISKGKFEIEGKVYKLQNANGVHLHGVAGFDKKYWSLKTQTQNTLILTYTSSNLKGGYPDKLEVAVLYEISENNYFIVSFSAKTVRATPVNLTCHPYFNRNGNESILEHDLWIDSDNYLEVNKQLIPTRKINKSENTLFGYKLKSKINKSHFIGLDDTFVLNRPVGGNYFKVK